MGYKLGEIYITESLKFPEFFLPAKCESNSLQNGDFQLVLIMGFVSGSNPSYWLALLYFVYFQTFGNFKFKG